MNTQASKGLTLLLLTAFTLFLVSSAFVAFDMNMQHDGCFSVSCGPTQHLLHDFSLPGNFSAPATFMVEGVKISTERLTSVARIPETPPPRLIKHINHYG